MRLHVDQLADAKPENVSRLARALGLPPNASLFRIATIANTKPGTPCPWCRNYLGRCEVCGALLLSKNGKG